MIGVGPRGGEDEDDDTGEIGRERGEQLLFQGIDDQLAQWRDAIYAQIVKRCGKRRYWENWADSVAQIARRHQDRIKADIAAPGPASERFAEFVAALRDNLNDSISKDDAAAMLSQHLITRPVFEALFGGSDFTARNPVSLAMQQMVAALADRGLEAETEELNSFYDDVRDRVKDIDNPEGRQRVAIELYDTFFRKAFPKDAERLGIVYTPVEIVDFIIRAVADLLESEFGASLGDEGVHILDPFTGTGTFVAQLLQSGRIGADDLPRKYAEEIHANEIMLLAYYIAAVNIENAYHGAMQAAGRQAEYEPFSGIVLTDTFQASEPGERHDAAMFPTNDDRMRRQLGLDIRVIIGNPPWSVGQGKHDDENPNQTYLYLDGSGLDTTPKPSIAGTYAAQSAATNKVALYDHYVRAIRWASNRVLDSDDGGVIGFVTNGGFIDTRAFDGLRNALASEFHAIHVFNLRGNARTSADQRKREGGNAFGSGTRAGVAILMLVKRPGAVPTSGAEIRYRDIGDYLDQDAKLEIISESTLAGDGWRAIKPNRWDDWINQRTERFMALRPLGKTRSDTGVVDPIFGLTSVGLVTGRDAWVVNSSKAKLKDLVDGQVKFYNEQVGVASKGTAWPKRDATRFKWLGETEDAARDGKTMRVNDAGFRTSVYRPFFKQHVYMDRSLNSRVYQLPKMFSTSTENERAILVEGQLAAPGRSPGILAVDAVPDTKATSGAVGRANHVFSRRIRNAEHQNENSPILTSPADNVVEQVLTAYRSPYGESVTSDHVFAYVYGVLHSPDYRERYAADLSRLLPRIPEVTTAEAFYAFAEAGQKLLDLHIGYEQVEPYALAEVWSDGAPELSDARWRVTKMKWAGTSKAQDRSAIVVNEWLTLRGIPEEAHRYVVGPRSALEWLLDRYQVRTDKASGIVNDPNDWGLELEPPQPDYIPQLVKRIVRVSVETMGIVDGLPALEEAD